MPRNRKAPKTTSLCLPDQMEWAPASGTSPVSVSLLITLFTVYAICGKSVGQRPENSNTPLQSMNHRLFTAVTYQLYLLQSVQHKRRSYFLNIKLNVALGDPLSCSRQTTATDMTVHQFSCFLILKIF